MARFYQYLLHKIYTSSDIVVVLKQAIAGELIEVDVLYYNKLLRSDGIFRSQQYNQTVFSNADLKLSILDEYKHKCNLAYSYADSSEKWSVKFKDIRRNEV